MTSYQTWGQIPADAQMDLIRPYGRSAGPTLLGYEATAGFTQYGVALSTTVLHNAASSRQGDYVSWPIVARVGTWRLRLAHVTGKALGRYHLSIDDVEQGTVEGYAAQGAVALNELNGIVVAESGPHVLKLTMASKASGSTGYLGQIHLLALVLT